MISLLKVEDTILNNLPPEFILGGVLGCLPFALDVEFDHFDPGQLAGIMGGPPWRRNGRDRMKVFESGDAGSEGTYQTMPKRPLRLNKPAW